MSEVDSGQVSLQPPKYTSSNLVKPIVLEDVGVDPIDTNPVVIDPEEVEAIQPEQEVREKWVFKPRQNQKWGVVEKQGLIVGRGANKKVVPPDEVWKLASIGCTDEEIATWYGIDRQTLKYNFFDYMAKGRTEMKQRLRQAQFKCAMGGNATLLIWLGKNMLGQSDNPTANEGNQPLPWTDD